MFSWFPPNLQRNIISKIPSIHNTKPLYDGKFDTCNNFKTQLKKCTTISRMNNKLKLVTTLSNNQEAKKYYTYRSQKKLYGMPWVPDEGFVMDTRYSKNNIETFISIKKYIYKNSFTITQ